MNYNNNIAIISGTGAVINAWMPIQDVFRSIYKREINIEDANFLFTKHIYLLRTYSKFKDDLSIRNLKIEKEQVFSLKELVCEFIKIHQNSNILKPRKEFENILMKFVFSDMRNMFGFVTTNWDTVIDDEASRVVKKFHPNINKVKCFHLHGSIETPNNLYLPSEISLENYRTDSENEDYGIDHYNTLKFLKNANKIIIYGISLDPLDAELNTTLNAAFTGSKLLKEIIIINPDYNKIKNRVQFLLFPRQDVIIKCFIPEDLNNEV